MRAGEGRQRRLALRALRALFSMTPFWINWGSSRRCRDHKSAGRGNSQASRWDPVDPCDTRACMTCLLAIWRCTYKIFHSQRAICPDRGGSRNFIWGGARGAEGAEVERRRRRGGGVWGGVSPSPLGEGSGEGAVPPPQKFFSILHLKWPVLVDSDVLHVLLIVVVKLETCTKRARKM